MEISHIIFKQTPKNEILYPLELAFPLHENKRICLFLYVSFYVFHHIQRTNHLSGRRIIIVHKTKNHSEELHINQLMAKSRLWDIRWYSITIYAICTVIAAQVFPVPLDILSPTFSDKAQSCFIISLKFLRKLGYSPNLLTFILL